MSDLAQRKWALALLVGLMAGCAQEAPPADVTSEPQDRVEQSPVVVTTVDRAGYDAVLVSLKGKVVLVDCWASWCVPCLEQLPHTLELARSHSELAVVTLAFDSPDKNEQIAKMLAAKGADDSAQHLVSTHGGSSKSMEEFDIPGGALPHYKLYDREGNLSKIFALDPSADTQFTTADIDQALDALLAGDGS